MDFLATFLGAAFGVVAGAAIQYLAQIFIDRHKQKAVLSDLRKEAQYNLGVANDMFNEVAKFRVAAQPDTFATYQWFFTFQGYARHRLEWYHQLGTTLQNVYLTRDYRNTTATAILRSEFRNHLRVQ